MAKIWEKVESILAGNLNSGLSYLITTVTCDKSLEINVSIMKNFDEWSIWYFKLDTQS